MLGDLDAVELECTERLGEQDHPGDDRGRAVGMQADERAALRFVHVGQAREQQLDGGEQQGIALDARGVVGVELLVDRGGGSGGAGDGDAARDGRALVGGQAVEEDRTRIVAGECLQLGGSGRVGV